MGEASGRASIALIGPMPPHRGGIAQYGLYLHRALARTGGTTTFSFRRQYPAWLYPGESDTDPDAPPIGDMDVRPTIDSLNPLSWFATADAIVECHPTALVIPWWTVFLWPAFMTIAWRVRRRGIPVILLCHNMVDHEAASWKERLAARMLRQANGYIVHSTTHRDFLQAHYPGRPILQSPIPSYDQATPSVAPIAQRGRLELLFFGFLRPYKGLDVLLDALEILDDPDVYLTIAGEAWDDCRETVERLRQRPSRTIETHLAFVPAAHAAELFNRADVVMLPYRAASGSAVTALAYGFDKPIIASRVGGIIDAVVDGETGILVEPGDARQLADVLRFATRAQLQRMSGTVAAHRQRHGWPEFAAGVLFLADQVRAGVDMRRRKQP